MTSVEAGRPPGRSFRLRQPLEDSAGRLCWAFFPWPFLSPTHICHATPISRCSACARHRCTQAHQQSGCCAPLGGITKLSRFITKKGESRLGESGRWGEDAPIVYNAHDHYNVVGLSGDVKGSRSEMRLSFWRVVHPAQPVSGTWTTGNTIGDTEQSSLHHSETPPEAISRQAVSRHEELFHELLVGMNGNSARRICTTRSF